MLKLIIYKEIADNFNNLRFMVGTILVVVVAFVCVTVLTSNYKNEVKDYHQRVAEQDMAVKEYAHTNRLQSMLKTQITPSKFHPLVLGISNVNEVNNYNNNPLNTLFPPFDFVIIVSIMLSLLAILFSYNAVSGEAELGTLRLMLSNSISRSLLLTGKWIGGVISISLPFIISMVLVAIYISISPTIQWAAYHWVCFLLICVVSLLFISIFYLIGLMVSCLTKNSALSILISLFIWVLFVLVIPNLSPYVSAQFYKIPSVNKIEKETNLLTGIERDKLLNKMRGELYTKYRSQYGEIVDVIMSVPNKDLSQFLAQNKDYASIFNQYVNDERNVVYEGNRIQGEKADELWKDLLVKSKKQTQLAKNIAACSPYSCFVYVVTDITGTGLHNFDYVDGQESAYYNLFYDYIEKKFLVEYAKDPSINENSYINLSDRPLFIFREEPILKKLAATMPYCLILLFFNGLFLLLTYVCFQRYDVR